MNKQLYLQGGLKSDAMTPMKLFCSFILNTLNKFNSLAPISNNLLRTMCYSFYVN